jgi:hypothetical protein
VPVPVPTIPTAEVTKVERTPVGVSGKGKDVATGVVASLLLVVEFTAMLADATVYTVDGGADEDASTTAEDETSTPVNGRMELEGNDQTLDGEEGTDSEMASSELAGEEDCAGGAAGLAVAEADKLSRLKPGAVGLALSDEEEGEDQVAGMGVP